MSVQAVFIVGRGIMVELSGTITANNGLTQETQLNTGEFRYIHGIRLVNGDSVQHNVTVQITKSDNTKILLPISNQAVSGNGEYNKYFESPIPIFEAMKIRVVWSAEAGDASATMQVKILETGVRL